MADRDNLAVQHLVGLPPAVLEQISRDPAKFGPWIRSLLALHIDEFDTKMAQNPGSVTIAQTLQFLEFLAKIGDAYPKPAANTAGAGNGFHLVINMGEPKTAPQIIEMQ